MSSDRSEPELRHLSATREGNYALWTALLTLEGFILGIFGAAAALKNLPLRALVTFIVVLAFIGGTLMLRNFLDTRNFYRALGQRNRAEFKAMTDEEFWKRVGKEAGKARRGHEARNRREGWTIRLLILQAAAIIALIWLG